jgi:hypothetical protein
MEGLKGGQVCETTAEVFPTPDDVMPFKVAFMNDGKVIAERRVVSELAGLALVAAFLPTLQNFHQT